MKFTTGTIAAGVYYIDLQPSSMVNAYGNGGTPPSCATQPYTIVVMQ